MFSGNIKTIQEGGFSTNETLPLFVRNNQGLTVTILNSLRDFPFKSGRCGPDIWYKSRVVAKL